MNDELLTYADRMNDKSLDGDVIRLEPLAVDHVAALFPSASDPEVWRWMPHPRPTSVAELRDMLGKMTADPAWRCFAVRRRDDDTVIGSTSIYALDLNESRAEIGATWFDRSCWGGPYNAESKLLLFGYAFDDLRLVRLAMRTDSLNVRSQNALVRLGLVHEGTLRSHMRRQDGTRRDSMYYSLLADEWPATREMLRARVAAKTTNLAGP
ncbi:GNAT family N-acetyltransferase [Streptomyces sp. NBC_00882]|uniref:GNAT family N-acetyltransferase n=1 Tax=Streptomyces sp. NBC_00882 TaxID=2975856 RepID=UPI003866D110|nr:GNAT family N-acetyltransferase [Streptomyces sp. NBC_00882]